MNPSSHRHHRLGPPAPHPQRRRLLCAAALALAAVSAVSGCKPAPPVPFKGIDVTGGDFGKDFRLTDPDGRERTLADFKGRAVMLFFGYTQCPDVCPTTLGRAVEIRRLLGKDDGGRLQVVFVTLDPERDTPELLKAYMAAFDPGFLALRGNAARTAETAREFKVHSEKVPTGSSYTMDHSAFSYVFDPRGQLRLILRHEQSAQDCASDLRQILSDAA